jgi:tetratricopeptide (TPR) repeat protein
MRGPSVTPAAAFFGIAVVATVLLFSPGFACDWTYYLNIEGARVESEFDTPSEYVEHLRRKADNQAKWRESIVEAEAKFNQTNDFKWRSDFAVCLMHLGEPQRAAEILAAIEREHPGEYAIAANLGTAHELSGDNERALEWIREGIRRNQNAHHGSEWLHAKVLETKLAIASDPAWLQTHSVLGLDFGPGPRPQRPREPLDLGEGTAQSLTELQKAIEYQLGERLGFVAPPDPIVADLIFDLGNVAAFTQGTSIAAELYDLSLEFKPVRQELVSQRLAALAALPSKPVAAAAVEGAMPAHMDRVNPRTLRLAGLLVVAVATLAWLVGRRLAGRGSG